MEIKQSGAAGRAGRLLARRKGRSHGTLHAVIPDTMRQQRGFRIEYKIYKKQPLKSVISEAVLVRVVRLERTVSWSQTRRDTNFAIPGYSISAITPRREGKSEIFLPVVKADLIPFSVIGGNPANAGVTRPCGVSSCPIPDTATALSKQARYQLRHTRSALLP